MIFSLIYAADLMGLKSLNEFKAVMRSLNDPHADIRNVNPEIVKCLTPTPTPEELNLYFIEMAERNNLTLD